MIVHVGASSDFDLMAQTPTYKRLFSYLFVCLFLFLYELVSRWGNQIVVRTAVMAMTELDSSSKQ